MASITSCRVDLSCIGGSDGSLQELLDYNDDNKLHRFSHFVTSEKPDARLTSTPAAFEFKKGY